MSFTLALTQANCPNLTATPPLQAKLILDGDEAHPCALNVTTASKISATGSCNSVKTGATHQLILRWFVDGPQTKKEVILAEAAARLDLSSSTTPAVAVDFSQAKLKTKAAPGEPSSEEQRFNCDRAGTNYCDSATSAPAGGTDQDTCSNLEELCKGTLFTNSIDHC